MVVFRLFFLIFLLVLCSLFLLHNTLPLLQIRLAFVIISQNSSVLVQRVVLPVFGAFNISISAVVRRILVPKSFLEASSIFSFGFVLLLDNSFLFNIEGLEVTLFNEILGLVFAL